MELVVGWTIGDWNLGFFSANVCSIHQQRSCRFRIRPSTPSEEKQNDRGRRNWTEQRTNLCRCIFCPWNLTPVFNLLGSDGCRVKLCDPKPILFLFWETYSHSRSYLYFVWLHYSIAHWKFYSKCPSEYLGYHDGVHAFVLPRSTKALRRCLSL